MKSKLLLIIIAIGLTVALHAEEYYPYYMRWREADSSMVRCTLETKIQFLYRQDTCLLFYDCNPPIFNRK